MNRQEGRGRTAVRAHAISTHRVHEKFQRGGSSGAQQQLQRGDAGARRLEVWRRRGHVAEVEVQGPVDGGQAAPSQDLGGVLQAQLPERAVERLLVRQGPAAGRVATALLLPVGRGGQQQQQQGGAGQ